MSEKNLSVIKRLKEIIKLKSSEKNYPANLESELKKGTTFKIFIPTNHINNGRS